MSPTQQGNSQPKIEYETLEELARRRSSIQISAWISPALKASLTRKLRPVGGKISTLVRTLLEDWVASRE